MPVLSEHWSEGQFIREPGEYLCKVAECQFVKFNSGNRGVEFKCENNVGELGKVTFVLVANALWKLAQFARACGLTREECGNYDTDSLASHLRLVGRHVWLRCDMGEPGKNGKQYVEVQGWRAASEEDVKREWASPVQPKTAPQRQSTDGPHYDDAEGDIPF